MYSYIGSESDYRNVLDQADTLFENKNWGAALSLYRNCLEFAKKAGKDTSYLEMKIDDCENQLKA